MQKARWIAVNSTKRSGAPATISGRRFPRRSSARGAPIFHSAPDAQCVTRRTFIIPGDSVTVYKPYKGWYQIMYVNGKTGEDFEGWVEAGRLSLGGTLGGGQ